MARLVPLLTAIPLLVVCGLVDGLWTDRWGTPPDLRRAADRVAEVPLRVGDWEGHDQQLDPHAVALGRIEGSLMRHYVNHSTGQALTLLVVCGRPGPIAAHTPDVCYDGSGYAQAGAARPWDVDGAGFWVGDFQKTDASAERLRILWSWNAGGGWSAPDNPRLAFARAPYLYKVYVVRPTAGADEPLEKDPAVDFLRLLLPQVQEKVIAPVP